MIMEADKGMMWPLVKDCQQPSKTKRRGMKFPVEPSDSVAPMTPSGERIIFS